MIEYKNRKDTVWKILPHEFEYRFKENYAYMYTYLQVRIFGKVYKFSDPEATIAFNKFKMWDKLREI